MRYGAAGEWIMAQYSDLSDSELLESIPFDGGKVTELISRYMNIVFACAGRYSGSADYEELVSDGMAGLLGAVQNYDKSKGEFAAFAAVCVRNRMRNTVKKSLRRSAELSDSSPEEMETIADPAPTPEEVVIERENRRSLLAVIRSELTDLELSCLEGAALGFSYEEIAKRIGSDKKSVDNALSRARNKLRRFYPDR